MPGGQHSGLGIASERWAGWAYGTTTEPAAQGKQVNYKVSERPGDLARTLLLLSGMGSR